MLTSWLGDPNRDHADGLAILSHFTTNRMLLRSLAKNQTRYKREKLLYELQKQLKLHPAPIIDPLQSIFTNTDNKETDPDTATQASETGTDDEDIDTGVPNSEAIAPPVDQAGGMQSLVFVQLPDRKANSTENSTETLESTQAASVTHPIKSTENSTEPIASPPAVQEIDTTVQKVETVAFSPEDAIVAEHLEIAYSKMFNKKGMLINSLRDFKEEDAAGRKGVMEQIAGLKSDMEQVKSKVDYYKLHGKLPEVATAEVVQKPDSDKEIPDDPFLMQKLLHNERSTLSKLKSKLAKGNSSPEKLQEMEQMVQTKTELVNEILRRLGGTS